MKRRKQRVVLLAVASLISSMMLCQDTSNQHVANFVQKATHAHIKPAARLQTTSIPSEINQNADLKSIYSSIGVLDAWVAMTNIYDVVKVAVIDDSIHIDHPDLSANVVNGWSYPHVGKAPDVTPGQLCGEDTHGTKVTGIIAATGNNSVGIAGIAWSNVIVYAYPINCAFTKQNILDAVKSAINNGVKIINFSAGAFDDGVFPEVIPLLEQNDVLFIAAAGNNHTNNDIRPYYPASYESPNIISVAATDTTGRLTHWTQYGAISVDVGAPGTNIRTTGKDSGYDLISGTSASAPIVTGVAALLKAYSHDTAKAADIKAAILASATPIVDAAGRLVTDGKVNAKAAMVYLDRLSNPPPVITIRNIVIDDSASVNANGVLDPFESFSLGIDLQNIWGNANAVTTSLRMQNGAPIAADYGALGSGAIQRGNFYINNTGDFSVYREFPFVLDINAIDATGGNAHYQRRFNIGAGVLENGKWLQHTIQKDGFDDLHFYHLNVPDDATRVVFQLNTLGSTELALWGSTASLPIVNWGNEGASGPNGADVGNGYRQVQLDGLSAGAHKVFAAVSHGPVESSALPAGSGTPYKIRACYVRKDDPAGLVLSTEQQIDVKPGTRVTLHATSDGVVENLSWRQLSGPGVALTGANTLTPVFTAPNAGKMVFAVHAFDDQCHTGTSTVTVTVRGFTLVPASAKVRVDGYLYQSLTAIVDGHAATELAMIDNAGITDLVFSKGNINWQSANKEGTHILTFTAKDPDTGDNYQAKFTLIVSNQDDSIAFKPKSGGCTLSDSKIIDPLLPLMVVLATVFLFLRKRTRH